MTKNKFDSLLAQLGTGRWHYLGIALVGYWAMHIPPNSLGGTYLTPVLEHSCRIPADGIPIYTKQDENETIVEACWYLTNTTGGLERHPCTEWDFDNSTFTNTLTSEFQLVCDKEYLRPTFQSMYFLGALIASGFVGFFSDNFGRKPVMTVGMVTYSIMANCLNWLPNMSSILAARFIMGLMHPTSISVSYALAMEKCELRNRATVGIIGFFPWVLGLFTWAGEGYLLRDWRWLMLVAPLPSILIFFVVWFVDESPRWLIVKGRHDRALQVLERAARWNRRTLPPKEELFCIMKEIEMEGNRHNTPRSQSKRGLTAVLKHLLDEVVILFRTRSLRRVTLTIYGIFMVSGMVYYGLSLGGGNLGTDPYMYMALSGVMDIPGNTVTLPMVNYLGRKRTNVILFFLTGGALLTLTFIPKGWGATAMALFGKLTISCGYTVIYLHAAELFPTEVRVKGIGTSAMLSKVGSITVPFLIDAVGSIYWWAPSVICGGAAVFAGCLCFLLFETLGKPLPDTVMDLETNYGVSKRKPKSADKITEKSPDYQEEKIPLS